MNFWARKGIPYLPPLPIVGNNISIFFGRTSMFEFVKNIYNSFPDARYFGIINFQTPTAVLRDPELIKEICVKNFDYFLDHQTFVDEEMDPMFGKNIFSLKGDRWKIMRNTLSPSFTATKMKFMFELIARCSRQFVQYFLDHPDEAKSLETKDAFTRYTNDVIATAAFGISVDSMQNRENEFYLRGKDATSFRGFVRLMKFFGFLTFPKLMKLMGIRFFSGATYRFFTSVVGDAMKTREEEKIFRPDMLQLLIEARNKDNGVEMSIEDITAQVFIFFFAGFDPSSTLMCFVAHELAMNPNIQEKLRNEVDNLTESDITYETVSRMKYMDMVISEALRKYPPTAAVDRECVKNYTLPKPTPESKEYTAVPKTLLWIPIYALHHDPKYFPDPEKFDPERFNDENKNSNVNNMNAYVPFGLGPRKCIGNRFVLLETKILFVYILQNFILEKTEKTKHPVEFEKTLNVAIKGGSWVKLTKRN